MTSYITALSADVKPRQDPTSQRMSHITSTDKLPEQQTTKALIRLRTTQVPFLFAYYMSRFSHDVARIWMMPFSVCALLFSCMCGIKQVLHPFINFKIFIIKDKIF